MNDKKRCCGINKGNGALINVLFAHSFPDDARCSYNGKYFEKGRWFCGKHAPSKIEERERKSLDNTFKRIEKFRERKRMLDLENNEKHN